MDLVAFIRTTSMDLEDGEREKVYSLPKLPKGQGIQLEFVGVNAFAPSKELYVSLKVTTNGEPGVYPIALNGTMSCDDTTFPCRVFGSQRILLRPDAESQIELCVSRGDTTGGARALVVVSGSYHELAE